MTTITELGSTAYAQGIAEFERLSTENRALTDQMAKLQYELKCERVEKAALVVQLQAAQMESRDLADQHMAAVATATLYEGFFAGMRAQMEAFEVPEQASPTVRRAMARRKNGGHDAEPRQ